MIETSSYIISRKGRRSLEKVRKPLQMKGRSKKELGISWQGHTLSLGNKTKSSKIPDKEALNGNTPEKIP